MAETFLSGKKLSKAIKKVLKEPKVRCAVAFWGHGATDMLKSEGEKQEPKIICNLASGGTNPDEIKKLQKRFGASSIKQMDTLHAKVYIGEKNTVIASANASANGLGFEGIEQAKWLEAGVLIKTTDALVKWFDDLFEKSREISREDIRIAKDRWGKRQKYKPTLLSFSEYKITDNFPLLYWIGSGEMILDNESVQNQNKDGIEEDEFIEAVKAGLELPAYSEKDLFVNGRWVLCFHLNQDCSVSRNKKNKPFFYYTNRAVKDSFSYDGDDKPGKFSSVFSIGDEPSEPFNLNDDNFFKLFKELIEEEKYSELLDDTSSGSEWYRPTRLPTMKKFWKELYKKYNSAVNG